MKKLGALIFGMLLCLALSGAASAAVVFDVGAGSTVDTSATSAGLTLYFNANPDLDNVTFSLEEGESQSFWFGEIGTTENSIQADDREPMPVYANFVFDLPSLGAQVTGAGEGFGIGSLGYWTVEWNSPIEVFFGPGNSGKFLISISDVSGLLNYGGCYYGADLCATVTLVQAPVPVPAAVWLLGSGLVGLVGLRRKFGK